MELLFFVIFIAAIAFILVKIKANKKSKIVQSTPVNLKTEVDETVQRIPEGFDYPYIKHKALFTPAERSFLGVLTLAVGNEVQVFGKIRVADVITPKTGVPRGDWQKAFNKISSKHFDFILCDKQDLSIICAIELDDSSHQKKSRKERDEFLVGACKASDVPLIQVPAKATYGVSNIREFLSPYIKPIPTDNDVNNDVVITENSDKVAIEDECPKCSSKLVLRVAKKGKNIGKKFLACSSYPKCKHVEAAA